MGTFAIKGVLVDGDQTKRVMLPTAGRPVEVARECLRELLEGEDGSEGIELGITGANAHLLTVEFGLDPILEIEAMAEGLSAEGIRGDAVLSLGHENIYYVELAADGHIEFFNRNGQCAAGSGAFWYQQATRLGYDDEELAELALEADSPIRISGRCAVFAKSDMTHAINEGATQAAVSAGLARTLAEMVVVTVTLNRMLERGRVLVVGGVANNRAVLKYLRDYSDAMDIEVPQNHEHLLALGAAMGGESIAIEALNFEEILGREYVPRTPLPPLDPHRVDYQPDMARAEDLDTSLVFVGVDCGSVSTKCVLLDREGRTIGGVYLPTAGRPALQVLELMKRVRDEYGDILEGARIKACTTGSGRFLSQKILNAEYAVDEITCQAEGIKYLYGSEGTLSVIEIGGEDSKFLQLRDGSLYDYNMNPVCAAGTGTFLENLANLLGVQIKDEFSRRAFEAEYAIDLGDTCTLLSQSALASAASQGLPFASQIASLAYSSARNYISKTAEHRPMEGTVVFTGATAKNHALAAAFAAEVDGDISVPSSPELTGALGSALMARQLHLLGIPGDYSFRDLDQLNEFEQSKHKCRAECEHEHNCTLDVITFSDGSTFLYGDRCGRFSELEKKRASQYAHLPDHTALRDEIFFEAAGEPLEEGTTVGIARGGLFFDLYPFWASFFRDLGTRVVLSDATTDETLEEGKRRLDAEMCYPLEVLVGHYADLVEKDPDLIFLPDVVDMEPLSWGESWPRGFVCPLLQTIWGTVTSSLDLPAERVVYAQLNYRQGARMITNQLRPVAQRILGEDYSERRLKRAVGAAYAARDQFDLEMEQASVDVIEGVAERSKEDTIAGIFLGRSYTVYDHEVSKGSLEYGRQRGIDSIPQDFLLAYVRGWYAGRIDSQLMGSREDFQRDFDRLAGDVDNLYPAQLQKMLAAAHAAQYINGRSSEHGFPPLFTVLQDPFKCGPNAMLRHFLRGVSNTLRLTMDEHTAPAGMITRLEAFRNTCLARKTQLPSVPVPAGTLPYEDLRGKRVLIPEPSHHGRVFASVFENYGVRAEVLPRSQDSDLTLARRYVNGDECLPLIQNVQDFLEYAVNTDDDLEDAVFFQGWACGPCRYGLYASAQSLILNKAGFGHRKIFAARVFDLIKEFGVGFAIGMFDGTLTLDILYKLLHATRPYELEAGRSDAVFEEYVERLVEILRSTRFNLLDVTSGRHLRVFEDLIIGAAEAFGEIPRSPEIRPLIVVAGEFYVRLDDRSNQDVIRKIEAAGGEVTLSPASEVFMYTGYINEEENRTLFRGSGRVGALANQLGFAGLNWVAHRDESRLESAAAGYLADPHEPVPAELRQASRKYISGHYGGEPPMTVGRTVALAGRGTVDGAILVAPFTCMPGTVVEAQLSALRRDLDIPIVATYYDGKDNPSREELIQGLVYQAKQRVARRPAIAADNG